MSNLCEGLAWWSETSPGVTVYDKTKGIPHVFNFEILNDTGTIIILANSQGITHSHALSSPGVRNDTGPGTVNREQWAVGNC